MGRAQPTFDDAWAVVTCLPPAERRILARRLLQESSEGGEELITVVLHRFPASTQARLDALMTKSNEGTLASEERDELASLVAEYERLMLANTKTLLQASQPDLFDKNGRLVDARLSQRIRRELHATTR
jgi:hypothetical protein